MGEEHIDRSDPDQSAGGIEDRLAGRYREFLSGEKDVGGVPDRPAGCNRVGIPGSLPCVEVGQ